MDAAKIKSKAVSYALIKVRGHLDEAIAHAEKGNFQLQRKEGVEVKKCVVSVARLQTSSIFMRDMYGRVNKKEWFKK